MSNDCTLAAAATFEELQWLVHGTLCKHDRLEPGQTPLLRGVIKRKGKPCGLFFQVEGPRLMKNYAVWVGEENRVLCYDSSGGRFREIRLASSPDLKKLAG